MQLQKMPLEERIARMKNGYYAHPEYVSAAIESFAQMPITSYLSEYPDRLKKLSACVGITEKRMQDMSYREVAALIYQRWRVNPRNLGLVEAIITLTLPFDQCYEERKHIYEKYR